MSTAEDLDRAARRLHRHRAELLDELAATEAALREVIEQRRQIERPKYLTNAETQP